MEGLLDVFEWMEANLRMRESDTADMQYRGESQSGESLPLVYLPFDVNHPGHWSDRGCALDFAHAAGPGRVLDFGPGDGWPSLIVAPFVEEVVGVDGAADRVRVCTRNAERIGITNASFVHVPPGQPLPFPDASFDGVMACSSIEETPDPRRTLEELHRVLKPGGRLRFLHAGFSEYLGQPEYSLEGPDFDGRHTRLEIWERHIAQEWVRRTVLSLDLTAEQVEEVFRRHGRPLSYDGLNEDILSDLHVVDAPYYKKTCAHTRTFVRWLGEIGFSDAKVTYSGRWFAGQLFHQIPEAQRPLDYHGIDELLRPLIPIITSMEKPTEHSDCITAVK